MFGHILRKELGVYFSTWLGWTIITLTLLLTGFLFGLLVLEPQFDNKGAGAEEHIVTGLRMFQAFLFWTSGLICITAMVISLRLFSEERSQGTLNLMFTSNISDITLVLGKFTASLIFLCFILLLTLLIPILIFSQARFEFGYIVSGYLGILFLGATCLAIGIFFSSITPLQIVALISSLTVLCVLVIIYWAKDVAPEPFNSILRFLSIWHEHFEMFRYGVVKMVDVVYYLSLIIFFLTITVKSIESRRWK